MQTLVLKLLITSGAKYGKDGEVRAAACLHVIWRGHGVVPRVMVAVHKTKTGGHGKCMWESTTPSLLPLVLASKAAPLMGGRVFPREPERTRESLSGQTRGEGGGKRGETGESLGMKVRRRKREGREASASF